MSYETRRGQKYYYRARRVQGRVVKNYVGKGAAATRAAAEVAQRNLDRLVQRRRELALENRLALFLDEFDLFWTASGRALRIALLAHNYHRRRGEWRRRRASGPTNQGRSLPEVESGWDSADQAADPAARPARAPAGTG